MKPGGGPVWPTERIGWNGGIWAMPLITIEIIQGIRFVSKQPKVIGQYDQSSQDAKVL